jgi:predicted amidohydrolase YtcJ
MSVRTKAKHVFADRLGKTGGNAAGKTLQLYTWNGAYIGFEEKSKGSLEPGKLADFIVVDRDVLSIPPEQLKDVQVLLTFIGGELVYEKRPEAARVAQPPRAEK